MKWLILTVIFFIPISLGAETIKPPPITLTKSPIETTALNQALQIVIAQSPSLQGKEALLGLKQRKKIWSSNLKLSAISAQKQTNETASGTDMRGALTFEIPLFDDGGKSENVAKARENLAKEKDRIIKSFMDSITSLVLLYADYKQSAQMLKIADEQLKYFQQAQQQGIVDAAGLWSLVKDRENAVFKQGKLSTQYKHELLSMARLFGGTEWNELQQHVHTHVTGFGACSTEISLDTVVPQQCN